MANNPDPNVGQELIAPPAGFSEAESAAALRQERGAFFRLPLLQPAFVSRLAFELDNKPHKLDIVGDGELPVNRLVTHIPNPMVRPFVRILQQWVAPWGPTFMRPEGQRNISSRVTGEDSWAGNGCWPTCQAMVLRWWDEDNPDTKGKLNWPGSVTQKSLDPPELCRRLFKGNKGFVPCAKSSAPAGPRAEDLNSSDETIRMKAERAAKAREEFIEKRRKKGYDDPTSEFVVSDSLRFAIRNVTRSDVNGTDNKPLPLDHGRIQLGPPPAPGTPEDLKKLEVLRRAAEIKFFLHWGPVIALINIPGHWVVIDGYRGHTIYVCDPGNIMVNSSHWKTHPRRRVAPTERPEPLPPFAAKSPGQPAPDDGYFALNDLDKFESADGKFNDFWLLQVSCIDVTRSELLDFHSEWSDPGVEPFPT
ncbi:MAG: hypothetical protein AB1898_15015 [Acidobacteriota bacterium]